MEDLEGKSEPEVASISDEEMMEMMGKKKKMPAKPGMKIAIAMKAQSPKKAMMGKYK